jgi:hypothetical protein
MDGSGLKPLSIGLNILFIIVYILNLNRWPQLLLNG